MTRARIREIHSKLLAEKRFTGTREEIEAILQLADRALAAEEELERRPGAEREGT